LMRFHGTRRRNFKHEFDFTRPYLLLCFNFRQINTVIKL